MVFIVSTMPRRWNRISAVTFQMLSIWFLTSWRMLSVHHQVHFLPSFANHGICNDQCSCETTTHSPSTFFTHHLTPVAMLLMPQRYAISWALLSYVIWIWSSVLSAFLWTRNEFGVWGCSIDARNLARERCQKQRKRRRSKDIRACHIPTNLKHLALVALYCRCCKNLTLGAKKPV